MTNSVSFRERPGWRRLFRGLSIFTAGFLLAFAAGSYARSAAVPINFPMTIDGG